MAYSESPLTVQRMLEYLQPLLESSTVAWNVEPSPGEARRFAYKIREGLYAAAVNHELFPELARLYQQVSVRVVSRSRIEVIPAGKSIRAVLDGESPLPHAEVETRSGLPVEDIIHRWELGAEAKLYFPRAELSTVDLRRLYDWAQQEGVIFFENAGAITLMRHDPEVADYAWKPQGEEDA